MYRFAAWANLSHLRLFYQPFIKKLSCTFCTKWMNNILSTLSYSFWASITYQTCLVYYPPTTFPNTMSDFCIKKSFSFFSLILNQNSALHFSPSFNSSGDIEKASGIIPDLGELQSRSKWKQRICITIVQKVFLKSIVSGVPVDVT